MQSTKAKSNWYLLLEHESSREADKLDYDKEHNIHYLYEVKEGNFSGNILKI